MHNDPLERLSLDDVKIHPFFTGFDWRRAMLREPVKERSMYEPGEIERMNATMSQKVGNGKAMRNNKSKDDNSWWESRLPKVRSLSSTVSEENPHKIVTSNQITQ